MPSYLKKKYRELMIQWNSAMVSNILALSTVDRVDYNTVIAYLAAYLTYSNAQIPGIIMMKDEFIDRKRISVNKVL